VLRELALGPVVLVGHSVAAMIVVLVHLAARDLVDKLVLVAPSARYIDDGDYVGGFTAQDIDDLLDLMDRNHLGWQAPLAGMVNGGAAPEAAAELESSFCRMRPEIAAEFAAVTFRGDNRADLAEVSVPTLVLQSEHDDIAPLSAGRFVRDAVDGAQFDLIPTHGHCPHLTAPEATTEAIRRFVSMTDA
jgi:sigma-B regulation protein RsbQ